MSTDILQQDIQTLLEFFSKNTYRAGVDTQVVSFSRISQLMRRFTCPENVLMLTNPSSVVIVQFHHFPSYKSGRICRFGGAFYRDLRI